MALSLDRSPNHSNSSCMVRKNILGCCTVPVIVCVLPHLLHSISPRWAPAQLGTVFPRHHYTSWFDNL